MKKYIHLNRHSLLAFATAITLITNYAYCQTVITQKEPAQNKVYAGRAASLGIIGDTTDVHRPVKAGLVLMGGGRDVDAAFKWMIDRCGGGNVVIIRASGTNAYNSYVYGLGKISSVETLKIDTREIAENDDVVRIIRNAEMLFIAGGDQSVYMQQWKGTKTADVVNYLINKKKVPVGGTSAGCAILGQFYYTGEHGSAISAKVLQNPYDSSVTIYKNDFIQAALLKNVLTDQHYITRSRQGRHVTFMSRLITDWNVFPKGIAADERTAVCINEKGIAEVFGSSKAYFIRSYRHKLPEACEPDKPLRWFADTKALKVYEIEGTVEGNGRFNVVNFKSAKAKGGIWYWWWVEKGELKHAKIPI
ncbi:MAG: cyanophycinase [Chitinophagaceae bacterium]